MIDNEQLDDININIVECKSYPLLPETSPETI